MAGYGTDQGFEDWLAANGYALASGLALSPAVLRQRGSVYVDGTYAARFPGSPTGGVAQERAWPRTGATYYGDDISSSLVPVQVEQAAYAAALAEAENPGSLSVTTTGKQVKREKIGPIEVEYDLSTSTGQTAVESATPLLSLVEGLLAPLLLADVPAIFAV